VTQVEEYVSSRIDGEFPGFEQGRLFKLLNGQIWEQIDSRYRYVYRHGPEVTVFTAGDGSIRMQVEQVEETRTSELRGLDCLRFR
jgi:hypothetical protein